MWTEFEWENKVNINSKAKSLREFLKQLMESTNMSCLTPEASLKGDCRFLSANLYARSVFGMFPPRTKGKNSHQTLTSLLF
jgi:coatomer subunit beta